MESLGDDTIAGNITFTFRKLGNCEPICIDFLGTAGVTLNSGASICNPDGVDLQCPFVKDAYPCCESDGKGNPEGICFSFKDFYFYGRPGEWRPVCCCRGSQGPDDVSDKDPAGETFVSGFWNSFFPSATQNNSGERNRCPGKHCWTAAPYPAKQIGGIPPDGTGSCPERNSKGNCQNKGAGKDGNNCGLPLLNVCGKGLEFKQPIPEVGDFGFFDWPGSDGFGSADGGTNYNALLDECNGQGYSYTCHGAWYQQTTTGFTLRETAGDCLDPLRWKHAVTNNAFFLRVPRGTVRDESFCRDYDIKFDVHCKTDSYPGACSADELGDGEENTILVYHNRVLDERIVLYSGCTHKFTQGDPKAKLENLFADGGMPAGLSGDTILRWDLFTGTADPEAGNPSLPWQLWNPDPGDDGITVVRNDGDPANSSNPYTIEVILDDFTFSDERWLTEQDDGGILITFPKVWWGLVTYTSEENDIEIPFRGLNARALNYINIKHKSRNPGDVPNGLRDYDWYHSPLKAEGPIPSSRYLFPGTCPWWAGPFDCGQKPTESPGIGGLCWRVEADRRQGAPAGQDECNFTILPSRGSGRPDPICGPCGNNAYCCPYTTSPRCIPNGTYCCAECQEDQVCLRWPPSSPELRCCNQAKWESDNVCV